MVFTFSWKRGQRACISSAISQWSVPSPGQAMTFMPIVMLTEHLDRVALEVISLGMRVQLCEPCGIIHLINVSRQLMNIHTFHLNDCEVSEKDWKDKTTWVRLCSGIQIIKSKYICTRHKARQKAEQETHSKLYFFFFFPNKNRNECQV